MSRPRPGGSDGMPPDTTSLADTSPATASPAAAQRDTTPSLDTTPTAAHSLADPVGDAKRLDRSGWLWRIVEFLLALGITGMLVTIAVQVVGRLFGWSPPWTEEVARFLFMDGVFLGMAAGFRAAAHPRVSFLVARGPGWVAGLSLHATVACALFFFGILAWKSIELVAQQMRTNETSPALGLSMWIVTVPLAVGALLSIIGTIQSVYFDRGLRKRLLKGEVIA